jgi:hypothetical protein
MIGINVDHNKFNWAESVRQYQTEKKTLSYDFPKPPERITHKQMKQMDTIYNPILQTYRDKEFESTMKLKEKEFLINIIAKNNDKALCMEQNYNIISLQDKLKSCKEDPRYSKEKIQNVKKQQESTRVNYNIVSGIDFDKHHYRKPEDRPTVQETVSITINI